MVDYKDPANHNRVLWMVRQWTNREVVHRSVDTVVIQLTPPYGHIIWGYSVYRKAPGFRTYGNSWERMSGDSRTCDAIELFYDRSEAGAFYVGLGGSMEQFNEDADQATPTLRWLKTQKYTHSFSDSI